MKILNISVWCMTQSVLREKYKAFRMHITKRSYDCCNHSRELTKIHFTHHRKIKKQGQVQKCTQKLRIIFLLANKNLLGNIMEENTPLK